MKVKKSEIKDILEATFPDYSGRKFKVSVAETVWADRMGGGGSSDEVLAVRFIDGEWVSAAPTASKIDAPCGDIVLDRDTIVAMHSYFCGQDAGVTFYLHPQSSYLPRRLTA